MFMSKSLKISTVAAFAFSVLALSAEASEVKIHGSTTVMGGIIKPYKAQIEANSGHTLAVVANGSGRGIGDLVSGKADMAMISSSLDSTVAKMNKKTPGSVDGGKLKAHLIHTTKVAFIVNAGNGVSELSLDQIKGILTGTIKSWSEVGGDAKPILVVVEDSSGGLRTFTEKKVVKATFSAPGMRQVPNGSQIPKIVGQVPHAFGVASPATATASVKILKTEDTPSQPLNFVTVGEPNETLKAVINAAKAAAQGG